MTVALLDGSEATIRPVRGDDDDVLIGLFAGLSAENRHRRFFSGGADARAAGRWAAHPPEGACGLVAERAGVVVAHAVGVPKDDDYAEVAFAVADDLHGIGLGTALLRELARWALARGTPTLVADVLAGNREMLDVLHHAAPTHDARFEDFVEVELDPADVLERCPSTADAGRSADER